MDWNGDNVWKNTTDSFIFNLTDGKNISTAKLGYVVEEKLAIFCRNNLGPRMGDLYYYNNNWYNSNNVNNTNHYPNVNIPVNFKVEDYEVFQVTKQ